MDPSRQRAEAQAVAARLRAALEAGDLAGFGALLDDNVRWGSDEDTPATCHSRDDVLRRLADQRANGLQARLLEVVPGPDAVLLTWSVQRPLHDGGVDDERTVYQVLRLHNQRVIDIRGYPTRETAATQAGLDATEP